MFENKSTGSSYLLRLINVLIGHLQANWKILVLFSLTGLIGGVIYAISAKKLYQADLLFILDEKGGSTSSIGGLASQFGFDFSKGDNNTFNADNIIELAKSREIIQRALFTEISGRNGKKLLIHQFIEYNQMQEAWASSSNPELVSLTFSKKPFDQFSFTEDSILHQIINGVRANIKISRTEKKSSLIKVQYTSDDQEFAKYFSEALVNNLSAYYIDSKTKKARANINLIENRLDSVKHALEIEMTDAAYNQDVNQNSTRMIVKLPLARKQLNIQILNNMYTELIKNLESTKMTLMREEPLIQIVDFPRFPLAYKKPGIFLSSIIGAIVMAGLYTFYSLIKIIRKNESESK